MAFIGPDELFVLEKMTGRVRHVDLATDPPTVTTALTLTVDGFSERGLLGIALHPNWPTPPRVFLYYSVPGCPDDGLHRIARYTWNGTSLINPVTIQELPGCGPGNDNGGIILFGADQKLYAVIGDLNRQEMTQNFDNGVVSDTSVILRWNINGSTPDDNPFDTAGWEQFFAYGIRNSFGMTVDPLTGDLWDTENGEDNYDEINRIVPGANCGWADIMGPDSRDPQNTDDLVMIDNAIYVDPAFSWNMPTVAPTGIVFIDSCRWKHDIRFDCLVGAVTNGKLYRLEPNAERTGFALTGGLADLVLDTADDSAQIDWGEGFGAVTDLKFGPDGYLYVVSIAGAIYRVRPDFPLGDINQNGIIGNADRNQFINLLLTREEEPDPPMDSVEQGDFDGNGKNDGDDIQCFVESFFMDD